MKERPILFSGSMVRALLAGTKTQTRRIAKPVRHPDLGNMYAPGALVLEHEPQHVIDRCCPYGQPGDRLWVRETWSPSGPEPSDGSLYRADFPEGPLSIKFKPSIHMPRWASRILLEITGVRVERLQDIHPVDALKEGLEQCEDLPYRWDHPVCLQTAVKLYSELWEQINGPGAWAQNPWVWVVEFKRVQQASSGRPAQLEDAPCSA